MPEYVVSDHTYLSKFILFLFVGCVCYSYLKIFIFARVLDVI